VVLNPERVFLERTIVPEFIMVVIRMTVMPMGQRLAVLMISQFMAFLFGLGRTHRYGILIRSGDREPKSERDPFG
jgi:hypothetical protein